jgi:hypothetical protein
MGRRKVFVLNLPGDTAANYIKGTDSGGSGPYGINQIVDSSSPAKLLFGFNSAGFTATHTHAAAAVAQVLTLTPGTLVAGQKYTLVREAPILASLGRDANGYQNTKRYSWTAPTTITDQAASRAAMIAAILAKVNADSTNFATATKVDYVAPVAADAEADPPVVEVVEVLAKLIITESSSYGLLPSYPGPASWMMIGAGTEITHALTAGKEPVGIGTEMLANRCQWTKDGRFIKSGYEIYNFDNDLPVSGKTYTTIIITEKYGMTDHDGIVPAKTNEIILYVDNATSNYVDDLITALGA